MAKRPSLAESMKAVQPQPGPRVIESATPKAPAAGRPAGTGYFAATRQGLKRITFPATPEEHRRVKRLSADTGRSIEDLMREALGDLFAKLES